MVRSVGITAVVLGAAWTGLAGAQSSAPPEKARYINVSEEGKPSQRCKLIKTWREPNGAPAFQVQAVESGEMITIVGAGPQGAGGDPRAMSTRIFRWGQDNKPPAGAPTAPPTATASIAPPSAPAPARTTVNSGLSGGSGVPTIIKPQTPPTVPTGDSPVVFRGNGNAPVNKPIKTDISPVVPHESGVSPVLTRGIASAPINKSTGGTSTSPVISKPAAVATQSIPVAPTVKRTGFTPTPATEKPAIKPYLLTSTQSQLTPMGTQVIQHPASQATGSQLPAASGLTSSQPRLAPLAAGTAGQKSGSCDCCSDCNPCKSNCQSSCVCGTPSPMRQPFMSRLFKSNAQCTSTTVVCTPAPVQSPAAKPLSPAVVKATTTPAKPDDWHESWGKVESWKNPAQAHGNTPTAELTKRVNPAPVTMEPSKQPDPIKNPEQFRDLVMNSRLSNSKIPQEGQPSTGSRLSKLFHSQRNGETKMAGPRPTELPPAESPGRMVQIAADEPNAFWSPQPPPGMGQDKSKGKAGSRGENGPPQGMPPAVAGIPPALPGVPPALPGVMQQLPAPPRSITLKNPPRPPLPPYTAPPGPPRPMSPDTGVASSMGNAFTLPGTSRPIPADFGGTPQEPNGFDQAVQMGQGSPPIAYGPMPGAPRQPMPTRMAMGPQAPMGMNPLMSVPPSSQNWQNAVPAAMSANPASVSKSLASLKDSMYPSERETAAEQLSEVNWRSQPAVVESLIRAARGDPAATVRAACVHALTQMKVDTPAALALVRDLKSDGDPRVRQEAEEALGVLGDSGIRQTSHK